MAQAMREAWEEAATEHPAISFLFEDDAPYLTIWDANLCKCTHERIVENVYNVRGHRRTAQAFLCTMPGDTDEEGIDVVNVHAPSGTPKLTDAQRFQLIENLLQSSSRTKANRPIGEGRKKKRSVRHASSMDASPRQLLAVTKGKRLHSGNATLTHGRRLHHGKRLHSGKATVTHAKRLHSGNATMTHGRRMHHGKRLHSGNGTVTHGRRLHHGTRQHSGNSSGMALTQPS